MDTVDTAGMTTETKENQIPATGSGVAYTDSAGRALDVEAIRRDFPIFRTEKDRDRIFYLDSASSSQKPRQVIEAMSDYYANTHANVHRGVYKIAEKATYMYESARVAAGKFIGAAYPKQEIVFTKNVTEAVNLVAYTWGRANLKQGDTVLLSEIEHHANFVPWLMLAQEKSLELRFIPMGRDYRLNLDNLENLASGAKLIAVTAASNVLGSITDLGRISLVAKAEGARFLVDGAQLVPHRAVDVQTIDADFYGYTGHKLLGPTGIGILYAKRELLEEMPPFLGGGEMIADVRLDGFSTTEIPWKFEAGTPPIAEAVGLHAAIKYLEEVGMDKIAEHERALTAYAVSKLQDHFGNDITIFGPPLEIDNPASCPDDRAGVISFSFAGIHPHDVAQILDEYNVCVRAGHHCAKPLMRCLNVPATTRASFYLYNDEDDVEALINALEKVKKVFG
ncbi:MAG: SufS family cysteine desulfurase [Firmicutes bacterium]|nr:SufS family cysteine desulfurase [Bacillota bacterium]